jgi:hypothetical protein
MSRPPVQISPFHRGDRCLSGFVVSGRWPESTHEWAQFLALAVRLAAVPGLVPTTTVYNAVDDVPEDPQPGTVGLVTTAGPVLGAGAPQPGQFTCTPAALFLLHPPQEHRPSSPEVAGAAGGCVLLPGLPHLGLGHRAAWVEAELDGRVTRLLSQVEVDPAQDPDTAVLAMLLAA